MFVEGVKEVRTPLNNKWESAQSRQKCYETTGAVLLIFRVSKPQTEIGRKVWGVRLTLRRSLRLGKDRTRKRCPTAHTCTLSKQQPAGRSQGKGSRKGRKGRKKEKRDS